MTIFAKDTSIKKIIEKYKDTKSPLNIAMFFNIKECEVRKILRDSRLFWCGDNDPKICSICKITKLGKYFFNNERSIDGKLSICSECRNRQVAHMLKDICSVNDLYQKYVELERLDGVARHFGFSRSFICSILYERDLLCAARKEIKNKPKKCTSCRIIKSASEFSRSKNGYPRPKCKECRKLAAKKYRTENPHIMAAWREKNRKHLSEYSKNYQSNRRLSTCAKIKKALRSRLSCAIKKIKAKKAGSSVDDLGCSIEEFAEYLSSLFYCNPETGEQMTWENYGLYGWHLDHIRPLAMFDLSDKKQFLKACHYTNIQPLWAIDNLKKGAKINE